MLTRKELEERRTSSGLIPPRTAGKENESVKVVPPVEPETVEPSVEEIQVEEVKQPETEADVFNRLAEIVEPRRPALNETDLERRVSRLQARLNEFENEIAEFRVVHISRRGPSGPVGATGATGRQGDRGIQGESIVGAQGPRGLPGRDSTVPGPKGEQGIPGSVEEATAAANKFVKSEMLKFQNLLTGMIRQALQDCGATDEFGKAILIPGPIGATGVPGRDGKDSTIPGPVGATGRDGVDGKDSVVPGPPGRDGKDSVVPGPRGATGAQGLPGRDGKDSVVPGPPGIPGKPGIDGRDGIDGLDGREGIPGPAGKVGNIDAAVHNAEKAALALVQRELEKFKSEFLSKT